MPLFGWLQVAQRREAADDQEQGGGHHHDPIGVGHRRQSMGPSIAQPTQGDGQVEDHDRAHHGGPPHRH
jgi:hypothetical protein